MYAEEHVPFGTNYFFKVSINPVRLFVLAWPMSSSHASHFVQNHNIHIRVHRQQHAAIYNFHALHKTIKHDVETCIWHDDEPLAYFES